MGQFVESYRHGMWGTVETGAVVGWRLIRRELPRLKIVVVRRAVDDVLKSLRSNGVDFPGLEDEIRRRDAMLEACSQSKGAYSIPYDNLAIPGVCEWLFETCLELDFDPRWYESLRDVNIQIDLKAQLARVAQREPQLAALRAEVEREGRALCEKMN
jgi:hypothetical protein